MFRLLMWPSSGWKEQEYNKIVTCLITPQLKIIHIVWKIRSYEQFTAQTIPSLTSLDHFDGWHHDALLVYQWYIKPYCTSSTYCFLIYARLHVSTLIIGHLQAFLQLSSQILCIYMFATYFHFITFRNVCPFISMSVFCSSLMSCFPDMLIRFLCLNDFDMVPGSLAISTFRVFCISALRSFWKLFLLLLEHILLLLLLLLLLLVVVVVVVVAPVPVAARSKA